MTDLTVKLDDLILVFGGVFHIAERHVVFVIRRDGRDLELSLYYQSGGRALKRGVCSHLADVLEETGVADGSARLLGDYG